MKRPGFVTALAVLYIASGVGVLGLQIWSSISQKNIGQSIGVSNILISSILVFMGTLILIAGIGMFKGTRWGWFVSIYYQAFNIGRNFLAGVYLHINRSAFELTGNALSSQYLKSSGRVIIGIAIMYYFVGETVLMYFGIEKSKRIGYLIKLIGVAVVTLIVRDVLSFVVN